jgi:hypothetical protein
MSLLFYFLRDKPKIVNWFARNEPALLLFAEQAQNGPVECASESRAQGKR